LYANIFCDVGDRAELDGRLDENEFNRAGLFVGWAGLAVVRNADPGGSRNISSPPRAASHQKG
jgi:hypothetical protein